MRKNSRGSRYPRYMRWLILISACLTAQTPTVRVDRVEWEGVSMDHARFLIHLHASEEAQQRVRDLRLERVTIGGLPVFADPSLSLTEPVRVSVYFRDIETVSVLRQVLEPSRIVVSCEARFSASLPLLARLALWTKEVEVVKPVQETVPLRIPFREAVLAMLRPFDSGRRDAPLTPVETRYQIRWRDGRLEDRTFRTRAAAVAPGRVVTTGEAVEPWRYDASLAASIASGGAAIVHSEVRGAIRVTHLDRETRRIYVPLPNGKPVAVELAVRASARNVAIIAMREPGHVLPVRRGGMERIVLDRPVPAAWAGSPFLVDGEVAGIIQDERSAISFAQIAALVPLP